MDSATESGDRLSIFDLDRTLTRLPTYSPYLLHAARTVAPWRLLLVPAAAAATAAYKAGLIDRKRTKELMHRLLLGPRLSPDTHERATAPFLARLLASGFRPAALEQLAADRAEGRRLILATAAPDHYAHRIAESLGMEAALATRVRRDGDQLTHRIDGDNYRGAAKLKAIEVWIAEQGLDRSRLDVRFYSDNLTDVPTFAWADEAIAVNPGAKLRRIARERGWRTVAW